MDLHYRISSAALKNQRSKIKKIFMYRICGTGMGAAAVLLQEKGYEIEGGDIKFYPPMGDYLKSTGIPLVELSKLDSDFYKKFDLIVVGNVVGGKSVEARFIEGLKIPFISFPEALGALVLSDVNVVGIAGTHGKTTTTYLFTQVFENLGLHPGYFIGGVMAERPSSRLGDGKYFFIESDEYDSAYFEKVSKLRHYEIDHLILTSLEFDHGDIFKNVEEIKNQFKTILPRVAGSFIVNREYQASNELFLENKISAPIFYYGKGSEIGPFILELAQSGSTFSLLLNNKKEVFTTNVVGLHNILNLSTVILFAFNQGISLEKLRSAITNLKMVKRRQEYRGIYKGSIVVDDFAHHPRAVALTIDSVKLAYPERKIITIMEPNSATARSNIFQKEFPRALLNSDMVILAKPQTSTTIKDVKDLDCDQMARDLLENKKDVKLAKDLKTLRGFIDEVANKDSLLLILSNGTCLGLWESDFVSELKEN